MKGGIAIIQVEKNPYKSIVVQDKDGEDITISEGKDIKFVLESGEVRKGRLIKLQGKDDKLKLQIMPEGEEHEEIWSMMSLVDGSLELDE